ncbi:lipopolysaccharide biosynthesis protein [Desertivirga arenae]|uniref:lipopolysaccharide biosynthesis protein n=1 Tax=Desertivirga arenae TaxID=2810309 RepID=UPI001A95868F|nr:oligosaccharide flippase family protein [Pedobacter sp. SYSU D00823]
MINSLTMSIKKFFKGHERTLSAKRNILVSLLCKGASMAATFFLIPMTINYIQPRQYGIWLTLSSIISWFNFFDVGLGHGLKNRLAESNALNQDQDSKAYISSTYAMIGAISLIVFICFAVINPFLSWNSILNVDDLSNSYIATLSLIVMGGFCIQLVTQLIFSVLTAFQLVSTVSVVNGLGQILSLLGVFLLIRFTTPTLLYLVLLLVSIPIFCQLVTSFVVYLTRFKKFSPQISHIKRNYAKGLLNIGGKFFFIQIGALILFQTDNIILTQVLGPKEVAIFNVTYRLFYLIVAFFTIFMDPFWVAFADAYIKNDLSWIKNAFSKIYKVWLASIVLAVIMLLLSPYIYRVWVGESIKIDFLTSASMAIYAVAICWMTVHNYFINGVGKIRLQLILYGISALINIPIGVLFARWWGISGLVFSNILIVLVMGMTFYFQCRRILNGTAKGIWNK